MPETCDVPHPDSKINAVCTKPMPCNFSHTCPDPGSRFGELLVWPNEKITLTRKQAKALAEEISEGVERKDPVGPPTQAEINPPRVRATDPDTSHAAARQLSDKTSMLYTLLRAFTHADLTAEEASVACGYTADDGSWKRVSDLATLGYLQDTGTRRKGSSGRQQVVRSITTAGLQKVTT